MAKEAADLQQGSIGPLGIVALLGVIAGMALVATSVAGSDATDAKREALASPFCSDDPGALLVEHEPGGALPGPDATPPVDFSKPPPSPFASWDDVIESWIETYENDPAALGLDLEATPEYVGSPPPGCESWDEFVEWERETLLPTFRHPTIPHTAPLVPIER